MAKRYELLDAAWELIKDLVSPNRRWRDLPGRFGPWSTGYQRFRDWRDDGTFDQVLERLQVRLNQEGLIDLDIWMIDSTVVRATRVSSDAGKRGRSPY